MKLEESKNVTIKTVLELLAKRYGKGFIDYVYDCKTGEVKGFLQFLVNGTGISNSKGLNTRLSDGDVLAIIPPVGGG